MKPIIGISDKNRQAVIDLLNQVLSNQYVLYTKLRNYHWNVSGLNFSEFHKLFESQYEQVDGAIDETAERVRALGGRALGTLKEFLQKATLKEHPGTHPSLKEMLRDLLEDHETVIRQLRQSAADAGEKYGDAGTNDFLIGQMEDHEKMAWMLRASLE